MSKNDFVKIFADLSAALGAAESKHPDFCQSFEDPQSDNRLNLEILEMYREGNAKNEIAKNENCEAVLFEEVYELVTAAKNPAAAYAEACDVAVVAVRIMEYFLKRGAFDGKKSDN